MGYSRAASSHVGRQGWVAHMERAVLLGRSHFSSKFPCNSGEFSEAQQQLKIGFKTEGGSNTSGQLVFMSLTTVTFIKCELLS